MVRKAWTRWSSERLFTWGLLVCLLWFGSTARSAEVTEQELVRLQKLLTPAADTAWRTIPWKIELLAAQELAARKQLPIFIWAMDGHPLGCT